MKEKNQPNEKTKKESIFGVSSEKWVDLLLHTNAVIYNIHPFLCASVLCAVHTHSTCNKWNIDVGNLLGLRCRSNLYTNIFGDWTESEIDCSMLCYATLCHAMRCVGLNENLLLYLFLYFRASHFSIKFSIPVCYYFFAGKHRLAHTMRYAILLWFPFYASRVYKYCLLQSKLNAEMLSVVNCFTVFSTRSALSLFLCVEKSRNSIIL